MAKVEGAAAASDMVSMVAHHEQDGGGVKLADKYKLLKAIGRGAYGTVFLAKRIADGKALVCKRVNMKNLTDKKQTDARLEVEFLQKFDNINITKYHE